MSALHTRCAVHGARRPSVGVRSDGRAVSALLAAAVLLLPRPQPGAAQARRSIGGARCAKWATRFATRKRHPGTLRFIIALVRVSGRHWHDRRVHDAVRRESRRLRQGLRGHAVSGAHHSVDLRQLHLRPSRRSLRREAQSDDDARAVDRAARGHDRGAGKDGVLARRARDRTEFRRRSDRGASGAARPRARCRSRALLQSDAAVVARGGDRRPAHLGHHRRRTRIVASARRSPIAPP